jgi:hypothetical protein
MVRSSPVSCQFRSVRAVRPLVPGLVLVSVLAPMAELPLVLVSPLVLLPGVPLAPIVALPVPLEPVVAPVPVVLLSLEPAAELPLPVVELPVPVLAPVAALESVVPEVPEPLVWARAKPPMARAAAAARVVRVFLVVDM